MEKEAIIACFSMEIALDPDMPTYSDGLGALAGETIRSAADLSIPNGCGNPSVQKRILLSAV